MTDERLQFVARRLAGEPMAELCRAFGISRKTGYKIFDRYRECGLRGLTDRSRRLYRYAHQLPFQVENYVLNVKHEHPSWGARKIRERLIRRFSGIPIPAKSTVHAVLDRHGLVERRGRSRRRAQGTAYHSVKLPSASLQSGNWYPPRLWDRQQCENRLSVGFASLVSQYSDPTINEPIPQQLGYGIDERLKMGDPPYNSLGGLARSMGLDSFWPSGARWFRCVCPVPLRFGPVSHELRNRQVSVVVEASQTTELPEGRVNGFVGDDAIRLGLLSEWEAICGEDPADSGAAHHAPLTRYRKAVDVGQHDGGLRPALAYKGTVVEEREQLLSPRNPWLRACQYFDPQFAWSKKLLTSPGSNNMNNLELGVVRLLAIAGLRVAWFGKESTERKRGILAYYESDGGRKTFAVVECTEVDPARKIDKAKASAKELDAWLGDPSCEVVPIVVTSAALKDVDLKAAFQAGVKLAGADELSDAWQSIERGCAADEVLKALTEIEILKHPDVFDL